jgi:hypothetical protein
VEETSRWREKKISEYYNKQLNVLMHEGLGQEEEDEN